MELIKPKDLAKKLGITTTTLSRWAKSGVVEDKTKSILGTAYTIAKTGPTGRVLYYAPVGEVPQLFEKSKEKKEEPKMEKVSINGEAPIFFTIEEFAKIAKTTPAEIKKWISGGEKYFQMMAKTRTGKDYGFFTGLDDKVIIAEIPGINPNLGGENETVVKTLDAEIASALKDLKETIEEQKSARLGGPELVRLIPVLLQAIVPLIAKKMEKSDTAALEYLKAFQQGLQMGLQIAEEREPEDEKPPIDVNSIIQALPHILPMIQQQQQRKQNGDSIKKIQGSSETGTDSEHNLQDAEFPVGTATGPFGPNSEDIFQ